MGSQVTGIRLTSGPIETKIIAYWKEHMWKGSKRRHRYAHPFPFSGKLAIGNHSQIQRQGFRFKKSSCLPAIRVDGLVLYGNVFQSVGYWGMPVGIPLQICGPRYELMRFNNCNLIRRRNLRTVNNYLHFLLGFRAGFCHNRRKNEVVTGSAEFEKGLHTSIQCI